MKRLHIFILKSYIGPFIMTFFIAMFVLLMQFLWRYIDELVGKGLETSVVAELLFYASFGLVQMALPLAILLSSLMTFGNLGENYELTALKSSGISLTRIMFPLILLTILLSIGAFFFANEVLPETQRKTAALLWDIRHQRPELDIQEGIFNNDLEDYTIKIREKNRKTNMMYDFMIYDHTERRGNTRVTLADSAEMWVTEDKKYLVMLLYSGNSYDEVKEKKRERQRTFPMNRAKFKEQRIIYDMSDFKLNRSDDDLFRHNYKMKDLKQLSIDEDSLVIAYKKRYKGFKKNVLTSNLFKNRVEEVKDSLSVNTNKQKSDSKFLPPVKKLNSLGESRKKSVYNSAHNYANSTYSYITSVSGDLDNRMKKIRRHQIEWHRKFTLPFACFIFFFIGAPLGAIIRKGGLGMPVVISVVFFIIYYVITLTGEKFARESIIPTWQGMWIASFILLPLGIFLSYKAARDSVILNISTYLGAISRLFGQTKDKK